MNKFVMLDEAKKLDLFDDDVWSVDTGKMMEFANRIETVLWSRIRGSDEQAKLRDHFAGLALQGTLARACPNTDTLAKFAYDIADKMLKVREVGNE
jgi:hypothetical protein